MKSTDHGQTWTEPKDITHSTKNPEWGWYATGPGIAIQIQYGTNKGRLVIPADHSYDDPKGKVRGGPFEYGSHVIYSDCLYEKGDQNPYEKISLARLSLDDFQ